MGAGLTSAAGLTYNPRDAHTALNILLGFLVLLLLTPFLLLGLGYRRVSRQPARPACWWPVALQLALTHRTLGFP